ncbi:TPA: helix-turn-helix domain-containing protein [Enterobacter asburiae]|nr:helix-turn-helix domain-containing protein [Enterobacter asburiae]
MGGWAGIPQGAPVACNAVLASSTLTIALNHHWFKGERLIAEELDVEPEKSVLHAIADMFLWRSPDAEPGPHFAYPIRHNPLNRKNSFLLSTLLP